VSPASSLLRRREKSIQIFELHDATGLPRLSRQLLNELRGALEEFATDHDALALIIAGTEKSFAAGAEIAEVSTLHGPEALRFAELGQGVMRAIARSRKPVIAAISGYCMGGGFDLALACHIRLASPDAVFAHRGASLGIITGWGGTQRLREICGPRGASVALDLMTTARQLTAEEAYTHGIIAKPVPRSELLSHATEFALNGRLRS
jgi:enoyl-CoA hydratase/carnithine racemase